MDDLRQALLREQGALCCYCMQRISAINMKIEHWASQSGHPKRQLEYRNLLGACSGGEGFAQHLQHCDTRKGERDIHIHPADRTHNCETLVRYQADGTIYSHDRTIDHDLNQILNLNFRTLRTNRLSELDGAIEVLRRKKPAGNWTRTFLESAKRQWSESSNGSELRPYCGIVVAHLEKKMAHLTR